MSLLREYIRKLLTEAAKSAEDLITSDLYVTIKSHNANEAVIYYSDKRGWTTPSDLAHGEIAISSSASAGDNCAGAWEIEYSEASRGWGPLLYDIAIEFATLQGEGLTSDRISVSPEARHVWDYYLDSRSDVASQQLDKLTKEPLPGPQLTPDITADDCKQASAAKDTGKNKWFDSSLSKKYTKSPTTINVLRAAGRLIEK